MPAAPVDNAAIIGNFTCRVERSSDRDSAYGRLAAYDATMESPGHADMHAFPASFYQMDLYVLTTAGAGETKNGCRITAPRPLTVWAVDVGCETAGGATGTVDVYADDGTTDASILYAAVDVKTGAGTSTRATPEATKADIAYGTELYVKAVSGAGGSLVGGQAHLYCQLQ